jgi:hypothetical protein
MGANQKITQHGSVSRTVGDKLLDTISVKDFGAKGDGVTDDTAAIHAALQYVGASNPNGRSLFFPQGTYRIASKSSTSGSTIGVFVTLQQNAKIYGDNATLKCDTTTHLGGAQLSYIMHIWTNGKNLHVDGLNFNGDNKSVVGLFLKEEVKRNSWLRVTNCSFENMYYSGSPTFYNGATGLVVQGQWSNIVIDKCFVKNVSRAHVPGNQGGSFGMVVTPITQSDAQYDISRTISISNCYFENITSEIPNTSSDNGDCDGIQVFGFDTSTDYSTTDSGTQTGPLYPRTQVSIFGNHFVNCRGRDIKIQNDETIIQNNTSYFNILPILSGARYNCQITSGIISNNVFHYDPVNVGGVLKSPFHHNGDVEPTNGMTISFYDGDSDFRSRAITITDNHIYNNVSPTVGKIYRYIDLAVDVDVYTTPGFVTIKGNKAVGIGRCLHFATIAGRDAPDTAPIYYTISDNMVENIQKSFIGNNGRTSFDMTIMSIHGNRHGGSTVRHYTDLSTVPTVLAANISAFNNTNIGLPANRVSAAATSFIPRFNSIGDSNASQGGIIDVQTSGIIASGSSHTFTFKGSSVASGKLGALISSADEKANFIFTFNNAGITAISAASEIQNGGTSDPGTASKVSVWVDPTTGQIILTNRTLQNRIFTLYIFG